MSIGATDYSKDRVQTSQNNEASFANIIANLDETEQQLNDDVLKLCILQREISQAIDAVDDVDCSLVLSKRYLLMKDWEQIADEMGYGIRQIFRIHKKALNIFEVPENMSHHVI
jgi:DNA-directed RNA polymerase specialized sigma subunit